MVTLCGLSALFLMDYLPLQVLHFRLIAECATLLRHGRRLFARPARSGAALSLSAATVGLAILGSVLVADSFGVYLPFVSWVLIMAPVTPIQRVPISLAGREYARSALSSSAPGSVSRPRRRSPPRCWPRIVVGSPGGLLWLTGWGITPSQERTRRARVEP